MTNAHTKKLSKKDVIIILLLLVNITIGLISVLGYFSLDKRIINLHIMDSRQELVSLARSQCLEETGGLDCDYVELEERLRNEFISDLFEQK